MRSHFLAGSPNRDSMAAARATSTSRDGTCTPAGGDDDRVALARRAQVPHLVGAEDLRDACGAGREAGVAPEQVHAHQAAVREHAAAVRVEVHAVEHRGGGLVVVQVHLENIHGLQASRVGDPPAGIADVHRQALVVFGQAKPHARADGDRGIQLDGRGAHLEHLAAEAREAGRAEAELHRMAVR